MSYAPHSMRGYIRANLRSSAVNAFHIRRKARIVR